MGCCWRDSDCVQHLEESDQGTCCDAQGNWQASVKCVSVWNGDFVWTDRCFSVLTDLIFYPRSLVVYYLVVVRSLLALFFICVTYCAYIQWCFPHEFPAALREADQRMLRACTAVCRCDQNRYWVYALWDMNCGYTIYPNLTFPVIL